MKLDVRPRCPYCRKLIKSKMQLANFKRYAPFDSYACQEYENMRRNLAYVYAITQRGKT